MPWIVFLRGANVGRNNRFQPALLAKQLSKLGVVNVGAVGTFVVRGKIARTKLRSEILKKLLFKPEVMICSAREILDLAHEDPFRGKTAGKKVRGFVSIMAKVPENPPKLPLYAPKTGGWEVQLFRISGNAALSLWRPSGKRILYPNEVVEKAFALPATTRSWNTIEKIVKILEKGAP